MKKPKIYEKNESYLLPLVLAAKSPRHHPALDVLYLSANDLSWGDDRFGVFLFEAHALAGHEGTLALAKARAHLGFFEVIRAFSEPLWQKFSPMLADVLADATQKGMTPEEVQSLIISSLMGNVQTEIINEFSHLFPMIISKLSVAVDGAGYILIQESEERRLRQITSTGLDDTRYTSMVASLRSLGLVSPVIRSAVPHGGSPEISLSSVAGFCSNLPLAIPAIEILRLESAIESFKKDNESALAVFMAAYLNSHVFHGSHAFASAHLDDERQAEVDLFIPILSLGVEVKIYSAPHVTNDQQIKTRASELSKQITRYASAGITRIIFASNLRNNDAQIVVKKAVEKTKWTGTPVTIVPAGVPAMIAWLDDMRAEIDKALSDQLAPNCKSAQIVS